MSNKEQITIKDKQRMLLSELLRNGNDYAIFGVGADVVKPLIAKGYLHADTFKFTGGAKLTTDGRNYLGGRIKAAQDAINSNPSKIF